MTTRTRPFSTPRKSSSAHKTPPKKIKAFAAAKKTETKPKAPDRSAKTGLLRKKIIIVTTKRKKQLSYRRNKTTVHRTSFYLPHDLITAFYFFYKFAGSVLNSADCFFKSDNRAVRVERKGKGILLYAVRICSGALNGKDFRFDVELACVVDIVGKRNAGVTENAGHFAGAVFIEGELVACCYTEYLDIAFPCAEELFLRIAAGGKRRNNENEYKCNTDNFFHFDITFRKIIYLALSVKPPCAENAEVKHKSVFTVIPPPK